MTQTDSKAGNPELWVDEHGDALYRYALSRLQNAAAAEDLVQETFLAALKSGGEFAGRSTMRTWLIGILKHKIIDYIRKASRERPTEDLATTDASDETFFDSTGRWRAGFTNRQADPRKMLEHKEFRAMLACCLARLPESLQRVFVLRELENQETEEICKELDVSSTNLWVMLHRARLRLQNCLTENWFSNPKGKD